MQIHRLPIFNDLSPDASFHTDVLPRAVGGIIRRALARAIRDASSLLFGLELQHELCIPEPRGSAVQARCSSGFPVPCA